VLTAAAYLIGVLGSTVLLVHGIGGASVEGFEAIRLSSPDGLTATFVPGAGMVGCSLTHQDVELLETRGGVARYVERRSTMGVPFLHPWGNRLGELAYSAAGVSVELSGDDPVLRPDPNGLPIHGALAASPFWQVIQTAANEESAQLVARLDYGAHDALLAVFPFPHTIDQTVVLAGSRLTISTTITPTGDVAVPIAFGWHPYFRLPGTPASEWTIELPLSEHLVTDERAIPTGEIDSSPIASGPLGDRTWDDGFVGVADGSVFSLRDSNRRIAISFERGYPVAIVWRPEDGEFICIEPMTAQTNALVSGIGLREAAPGEPFSASFSIDVS
jgi:galactose mutarotase-like enzyme